MKNDNNLDKGITNKVEIESKINEANELMNKVKNALTGIKNSMKLNDCSKSNSSEYVENIISDVRECDSSKKEIKKQTVKNKRSKQMIINITKKKLENNTKNSPNDDEKLSNDLINEQSTEIMQTTENVMNDKNCEKPFNDVNNVSTIIEDEPKLLTEEYLLNQIEIINSNKKKISSPEKNLETIVEIPSEITIATNAINKEFIKEDEKKENLMKLIDDDITVDKINDNFHILKENPDNKTSNNKNTNGTLTIQILPQINIRRGLVIQKTLDLNIIQSSQVNSTIMDLNDNVHYEEITSNNINQIPVSTFLENNGSSNELNTKHNKTICQPVVEPTIIYENKTIKYSNDNNIQNCVSNKDYGFFHHYDYYHLNSYQFMHPSLLPLTYPPSSPIFNQEFIVAQANFNSLNNDTDKSITKKSDKKKSPSETTDKSTKTDNTFSISEKSPKQSNIISSNSKCKKKFIESKCDKSIETDKITNNDKELLLRNNESYKDELSVQTDATTINLINQQTANQETKEDDKTASKRYGWHPKSLLSSSSPISLNHAVVDKNLPTITNHSNNTNKLLNNNDNKSVDERSSSSSESTHSSNLFPSKPIRVFSNKINKNKNKDIYSKTFFQLNDDNNKLLPINNIQNDNEALKGFLPGLTNSSTVDIDEFHRKTSSNLKLLNKTLFSTPVCSDETKIDNKLTTNGLKFMKQNESEENSTSFGKYDNTNKHFVNNIKKNVEISVNDDNSSDGEINCKCSVSYGEIHFCQQRRINKIRVDVLKNKNNTEKLLRKELHDQNLKLCRERTYYDNWVSYYVQKTNQQIIDDSTISSSND